MCRSSSPPRHRDKNVPHMRLGLLTRKPSDSPVDVVSCHRPNRASSSPPCHSSTRRRFFRRASSHASRRGKGLSVMQLQLLPYGIEKRVKFRGIPPLHRR